MKSKIESNNHGIRNNFQAWEMPHHQSPAEIWMLPSAWIHNRLAELPASHNHFSHRFILEIILWKKVFAYFLIDLPESLRAPKPRCKRQIIP